QRLGMDGGLVFAATRGRCAQSLLRSREPAWGGRGRKLRSLPTHDQDSAQGGERRLAPLRAQLLPPLSPGRPSCAAGRYVDEPCRLSMHSTREELPMTGRKDRGDSDTGNKAADRPLNRRSILLGGTTLAAASTLAAGLPTRVAQSPAQAQPAPAGQRPNILVIWG